jgi:hypothetical protein
MDDGRLAELAQQLASVTGIVAAAQALIDEVRTAVR